MDIFSKFFDWLPRTMGNLPPVIQSYVVRLTLILIVSCLFPAIAFLRAESRSVLFQRLLFIVGIFVGGILSIGWFFNLPTKPKGFLLIAFTLVIIFAPFVLPFFIAQTEGGQNIVRRWLAIVIIFFFIVNFLLMI